MMQRDLLLPADDSKRGNIPKLHLVFFRFPEMLLNFFRNNCYLCSKASGAASPSGCRATGFCGFRMGSFKHLFVPQHAVCPQSEVDELCAKYGVTIEQLPKIRLSDPGLAGLEIVPGQVIKILRPSEVTGREEPYYRLVVDG